CCKHKVFELSGSGFYGNASCCNSPKIGFSILVSLVLSPFRFIAGLICHRPTFVGLSFFKWQLSLPWPLWVGLLFGQCSAVFVVSLASGNIGGSAARK
ncbi:hypothetical protein ACOIWD_004435, partial [Vibrio vulnificus]